MFKLIQWGQSELPSALHLINKVLSGILQKWKKSQRLFLAGSRHSIRCIRLTRNGFQNGEKVPLFQNYWSMKILLKRIKINTNQRHRNLWSRPWTVYHWKVCSSITQIPLQIYRRMDYLHLKRRKILTLSLVHVDLERHHKLWQVRRKPKQEFNHPGTIVRIINF